MSGPSGSNGIVIGVVKDLDDPQKLGRVRVSFPHLGGQPSSWARLATLMAGADRGSLLRPEPEDEVLVAFLHGDPGQPYVIGALWNETDPPPEGGGTSDNHLRTLRSRSGHVLRFDDTPGGERVEVIGKDEKQRVVIDVSGQAINVEADQGTINVRAAAGDVTVEAGASMTVKAASSLRVEAATINIEASGVLTLKGSLVKIN